MAFINNGLTFLFLLVGSEGTSKICMNRIGKEKGVDLIST